MTELKRGDIVVPTPGTFLAAAWKIFIVIDRREATVLKIHGRRGSTGNYGRSVIDWLGPVDRRALHVIKDRTT
jgi:hypothetical protein